MQSNLNPPLLSLLLRPRTPLPPPVPSSRALKLVKLRTQGRCYAVTPRRHAAKPRTEANISDAPNSDHKIADQYIICRGLSGPGALIFRGNRTSPHKIFQGPGPERPGSRAESWGRGSERPARDAGPLVDVDLQSSLLRRCFAAAAPCQLCAKQRSVLVDSRRDISKRGSRMPEPWLTISSKCPLEVQSSQRMGPSFQIDISTTDCMQSDLCLCHWGKHIVTDQ